MRWPWQPRPAPVTTKSLADPTAELFSIFNAQPSAAGVAITPISAMRVPAVRCAVQVISEAIPQLPVRVFDRKTQSRDDEHTAARLLNGRVSEWMSGAEFIEHMTRTAHLYDNALAHVVRVNGTPKELIPAQPGEISVAPDQFGAPVYKSGTVTLNRADVFHLKAPGIFSWSGMAPISLARDAIGLAIILEEFTSKLFANSAQPGGVIEIPGNLGDDALKKLLAAWKRTHGGPDNAGKPGVLFDGAKFTAISFDPESSQLLELKKFAILEIARAFRVPPILLMDIERQSIATGEVVGQQFLTYSLTPWLRRWEGEISLKLLSDAEQDSLVPHFEVDGLLRASFQAQMAGLASAVQARIMNPNEAREVIHLPPYVDGAKFENFHTSSPFASPAPANDNTQSTEAAA